MKKIFILFILFHPCVLFSQPESGNGSSGDPYSGPITTPWTLSGDKYCGNLTVSSGTFTISPGSTLHFGTDNSLTISGTGVLSAAGNSSNFITFTSSGSTWGHIYFNAPSESNPSIIDFCIIENGDVHTYTDYRGYGGAIHANFSNLIISNSILRNNYAKWGGAVFIYSNKNPTIKNCYIYNNKSDRAGGGIYCWNGSGSLIENCIFDSNQCLEPSIAYYTGGGLAAQTSCSIKVLNCTFVNNLSTRSEGQSLLLHSSGNSRVINSIFWGNPEKQIFCYGTTSAGILINCAYRGITYSSGTPVAPVILNSSNSASDGPNFIATDGSDWSIRFISPCRDAGVNSYTGVTIPSADYDGNPRIGTKDIGTYEVQYSRWTGAASTAWATTTNWDQSVDPSSGTGDVIIPSGVTNYPNETNPVTIGTGNYLIIDPKAQATFGTLNNNSTGTLWLKSDSHGINDTIASLKADAYTPNGGTAKIELYLQGNSVMWHYISPPFASLPATTFSTASAAVAEYRENLVEDKMNNGWVTSTGYHYDVTLETPTWVPEGWTWSTLYAGYGYNYYSATSKKFNISGSINTDDFFIDLVYNSHPFTPDHPYDQGYNLIGNPYTCSLDWDMVVEDADNASVWSDAEATIYFRKNSITYYYNYGSGETVPDDYNSDGNLIPPMQGFFIKTNANVELTIPADAGVHSSSMRYKGNRFVPKIRLQLDNTETTDQTLIWFSDKATFSFDNLYDSRKLFMGETYPNIYTALNGINYAINGIAFPENSVSVPLVINATNTGLYTIKATQIADLDNYTIYLKDNILDNTVNLSEVSQYSFSTPSGLLSDRFTIIISDIATTIPENTISNKPFNIYSSGKQINIHTLSDNWNGKRGDVKIMDLTGKTVSLHRNVSFSKDEIKQIEMYSPYGIYFVEIRSRVGRYVGKVVIK